MSTRRTFMRRAACAVLPLAGVAAHAAQSPDGKTVLTVSSAAGGRLDFTMAALAELPQRSFTTRTPWYPDPKTFTGPLLRDVLDAAHAQGSTLRMTALNNYRSSMPAEDARRFDVILARLLDGSPMAVREKGPLFVIYPYDSSAELRSELFYSRSAWQLRSIESR